MPLLSLTLTTIHLPIKEALLLVPFPTPTLSLKSTTYLSSSQKTRPKKPFQTTSICRFGKNPEDFNPLLVNAASGFHLLKKMAMVFDSYIVGTFLVSLLGFVFLLILRRNNISKKKTKPNKNRTFFFLKLTRFGSTNSVKRN